MIFSFLEVEVLGNWVLIQMSVCSVQIISRLDIQGKIEMFTPFACYDVAERNGGIAHQHGGSIPILGSVNLCKIFGQT